PEHFPALAHFGREVRPLGADRHAAFEEILAAQLADIEAAIRPG
ncbi:TetR/AcrR family transcriptional regulator, partial [Streptodolium elevatio]